METETKIREINAENLNQELNSNKRPVLINALDEEAYMARRIPGSINIPSDKANLINAVVPDKEQPIVVYCANSDCTASPELAGKLMDLNFTDVRDFDAGLAGWRNEGYELTGRNV
ncbi:rhodanese-like domain-containing protein [Rhodohalobacter mucosus]|uniref:Rhodanese-like domain-containing protein n=1 Tax=Rhodohalobacter mucosus TaxID=2079485 RepID=A0A316U233_9BACT|nr:rhodanese-like domain-containing protein [Rhodohalobacter mucosus]PWN07156.1 rhodanese-like domain-containing protein [Rhodohalobacter mucosus]